MKSTPEKPLPLNLTQQVPLSTAPSALQDEPYSVQPDELVLSSDVLVDLMRQVLSRGMPFRFHARGGSMVPFILDGDAVCVAPFGKRGPGFGEVVVFLHPQTGHLVVHRVVGKHGQACLIQGDNIAGDPDGLIPIKNLLGRVTRVERNGRQIWLGLGPERYLIALSSRSGLLIPVLRSFRSLFGMLFR